jgi:hypothetical protein
MRNIFTTIALLATVNLFAQNRFCFTTEMQERWFLEHPELRKSFEQLQNEASETDKAMFAQGYKNAFLTGKSASSSSYTIPVVFHILHTGGNENISDAQVKDAVAILTRDFNAENADTANVVASFKNKIGNTSITFALATKDPDGNCTNGIIRHWDANTKWDGDFVDYKYSWPRQRYLNIYVVKTLENGAAGYTFLPGSGVPASMDAILILSTYVGSIGSGNLYTSRALTHEVGHWLNLPHTWGGTNQPGVSCGDDGVSDTPVTKGYTSCNLNNTSICNASIEENIQNYMDYAYCQRMFTTGQSVRMQLSLNGTASGRNNLSSPSNLAFTGVSAPAGICAPQIDLVAVPSLTVCAGQTITINSFSYNANPGSYSWTSSAGAVLINPSSPNIQLAIVNPGLITVTCTAVNTAGSASKTLTITALNGLAQIQGAYSESFEQMQLPQGWNLINPSLVTWSPTGDNAIHGNVSMFVAGEQMAAGETAILESPSYDFKNNPGARYTFKYAYRRASLDNKDVFKVQASKDCGGSWTDVYVPGNHLLANGSGGVSTTLFNPFMNEWKYFEQLVDYPGFNAFRTASNVRLRFFFQEDPGGQGYGNRFYLDEVNFAIPVGINDLSRSLEFNVYPNPARRDVHVDFTLSDASDVKCRVTSLTGALVAGNDAGMLPTGAHRLDLSLPISMEDGVYFLTLEVNGARVCRKLVVQ